MAGVSSMAQYQQSRTQAAAYKAQAKQDEANARIEERKRDQENIRSLDEKRRLVGRAKDIAGQNTAAFGAGGIDSSSGTGLDLKRANQETLNQDLWTNTYNLGLRDTEIRQNVANLNQSAVSNRQAAKEVKRAGKRNSILSFATSIIVSQALKGLGKGKTGATSSNIGISRTADPYSLTKYGQATNRLNWKTPYSYTSGWNPIKGGIK